MLVNTATKGNNMSELLVKRELLKHGSLSKCARETGMHPSSVSQISNGRLRPYPSQVAKLVSYLEWTGDPSELFKEAR